MKKILEDIKRINRIEVKSIDLKIIKFNEEFGEFCAEYLKMIEHSSKPADKEHLIEEMADALQCMFSIYLHIEDEFHISLDKEVFPQILEKNKKWENKMKENPFFIKKQFNHGVVIDGIPKCKKCVDEFYKGHIRCEFCGKRLNYNE
jgi:hypothetical protein